jgi:hypothetical protein
MRILAALLLVVAQDPAVAVSVEFRVFAGTEEITAATRLRIMPTGTREKPAMLEEAKRLRALVSPGIYDVQALRMRPEGIVAIRWAERLVLMHYPDEAGAHLEVINFQDGYGALQVRSNKEPIAAYDLAAFPAGDRTAEPLEPLAGDDYRLFVVKAGRYDIRVRPAGARSDENARWVADIEVPPNRTRMKIVDGS